MRIDDCELGHNLDDLTNTGSELAFAFKQVSLLDPASGYALLFYPSKQVFVAGLQEPGSIF